MWIISLGSILLSLNDFCISKRIIRFIFISEWNGFRILVSNFLIISLASISYLSVILLYLWNQTFNDVFILSIKGCVELQMKSVRKRILVFFIWCLQENQILSTTAQSQISRILPWVLHAKRDLMEGWSRYEGRINILFQYH